MNKESRKILILSVFIWIIANLHHPVTPSHFTSLNMPNHLFGTSYSAMVLAMFIMSPVWGSIGDQGYRKEILVLVTFSYGIFQMFFGFSKSIWLVILMRAMAGGVASGFHVGLMSSLVDLTEKGDRQEIMAKYSAIMSISGAIGFLIGGLLGYFPTRILFLIQGLSMILVSLFIFFLVGPTNRDKRKDRLEKPRFIWDIIRTGKNTDGGLSQWIKIFLGITFFVGIGYSSYNNAFNYYLKSELNMEPIVNGIWKAVNGIVGLLANLTINTWLIRKTDTKKSIIGLLFLTATSGFLVYYSGSLMPFFIFNFMFFTLYTIQVPILQGFAVEDTNQDAGLMSGYYNASKSLGEMLGSSLAGFSYDLNSKFPFLLGAIAISMAFILSFKNRKNN